MWRSREALRSFELLPELKNAYDIRWDFLPECFFSGGTVMEKNWEPGMALPIPGEIIIHHANWVVGAEYKIAQLKYVRDLVRQRVKVQV